MQDQHYVDPELACLYDLDSGWSEDRDFYLSLAGNESRSILDIGCGTGLLACAYATKGHRVTAIDPAEAMLDIARKKPDAHHVDWVLASAETFRSTTYFDLIVMTGNALMALLRPEAIIACFETMKRNLEHNGRIVFEVRNPDLDWSSDWNYAMTFNVNGTQVREKRHFVEMDGTLMRFEFQYVFPDKSITTQSTIRFNSKDEIEYYLNVANLEVESLTGGWQGEPFDPELSRYMIFNVRHKMTIRANG